MTRSQKFTRKNPNNDKRWGKSDDVLLFREFKEMAPDFGMTQLHT